MKQLEILTDFLKDAITGIAKIFGWKVPEGALPRQVQRMIALVNPKGRVYYAKESWVDYTKHPNKVGVFGLGNTIKDYVPGYITGSIESYQVPIPRVGDLIVFESRECEDKKLVVVISSLHFRNFGCPEITFHTIGYEDEYTNIIALCTRVHMVKKEEIM